MPGNEFEVIEYENTAGKNAFALWAANIDTKAFVKVTAAITRMRLGNFGDVKSVGRGVSERRINFGPGYRIHFGRDGRKIVVLLGGGTKSRQNNDVEAAQEARAEYKKNKTR